MTAFNESHFQSVPISDLGLKIEGTPLEPIIREFESELDHIGITRVRPLYYLSTEWGVPTDTIAIAIPFYLARPELTELHRNRSGYIEGVDRREILRYLRHEMGHVINYAYRLFDEEDWVKLFGSITQPYLDNYRPQPFSRRFVQHLAGWYAQKHPDDDWAETFAVWMTPGYNWRAEYRDWPGALAKLEYCERTMAAVKLHEPIVTSIELDLDVADLNIPLEVYYEQHSPELVEPPSGLDGALRSLFEDLGSNEDTTTQAERLPASGLIRKLETELMNHIYRWTGHFPEQTQPLLRHIAYRADELQQVYPADREQAATIGLTAFVSALAMNYVYKGSYSP